jgi:hypothetical protein
MDNTFDKYIDAINLEKENYDLQNLIEITP